MLSHSIRKKLTGFTMVELLTVIAIIGIIGSIAIPKYLNFRRSAMDAVAKSTCEAIIKAQTVILSDKGNYSADYGELVSIGGLNIDRDVYYGPITLGLETELPRFSFHVNHKGSRATTFFVDSIDNRMVAKNDVRIDQNCPTVPLWK
jgi:prepilin-type N-terminal cleavage/methylation domain-containing protein